MKKISVNLGKRSYQIIIGYNIIGRLTDFMQRLNLGKDAVIITNARIKKILGRKILDRLKKSGFSVEFERIPDSEKSKSQAIAFSVIDRISHFARLKTPFIIALGGGVVGDLAGFIASVYKRGIPYIQIPTTLLAQVDSSIGGKVGIDLSCGKNLVGAFYQPRLVLADIALLRTLPKNELTSGLAEVIKYGLIKDRVLFAYIEKNYQRILGLDRPSLEYIINRCALIKADIVAQDEKETKGVRTVLNFGHTIGHAIEAAGNFKAYSHGQAVVLWMLAAAEVSFALGLLSSKETISRIKDLFFSVGLPLRLKGLSIERIIKALAFDKKFIRGKNRFVLLRDIGEAVVRENIPVLIIRSALKKIIC